MRKLLILMFVCICGILTGEIVDREGQGFLEKEDGQLILHLKGNDYDLGFQHGRIFKEKINQNIAVFVDQVLKVQQENPQVKEFLKVLPNVMKYVPERYVQEMHGLADGAGVSYDKVVLLNVFPEMFHCLGLTVAGKATQDQTLYHVRVLDYGFGKNLMLDSAVLMVVQPEGRHAFLNLSFAGLIGSITGMNDQKIAIGEIGGLGYGFWDGIPMTFLLREVLEKSTTLEEALQLLETSPRTCEYYYVISDGKSKKSAGIYATASQIHRINPGDSYALLQLKDLPKNYGTNGRNDKFFLDPYFIDQSEFQTAIYYDSAKKDVAGIFHRQPEECVAITGYANPKRYPVLMQRLLENYGHITLSDLQKALKPPVTCETNLHNAIFAPETLEVWVSHGTKQEPASEQNYYHYNLTTLIEQ